MTVRRLAWRGCYELLAQRIRTPAWAFMNYGFAPLEAGEPQALDPSDEADRLCIQLYAHVLSRCEPQGRDVLEVGSGRGGGASFVARYLQPRSMTGVDFSAGAVALCTRHREEPGLSFVHGDAHALPFPDASFDVVVNVESSHCYESMETFLCEVARVLRPGGRLCFADLRDEPGAATLRSQLRACGLQVLEESDITANVLAALALDNDRKLALIDELIPRAFHRPIRVFAGIRGTRNYAGLETGRLRYLSACLAKGGAPPGQPET